MSRVGRATRAVEEGARLVRLTRFGFSNCYLVREDDGLTLVDTSFPGSEQPILAAAAAAGAPIARIAITHVHHDHAGSLEALRARLPDAEIAVGEREAALLAGDTAPRPGEPAGRLKARLYEHADVGPDRLLRDGDRVGSLEVVASPGHTPGHLAFLDTRDRALIGGDAFLTIGGLFVTTELRLRFPFPALAGTWHADTALASAQRLSDLAPSRLATGHGPVLADPHAEMLAATARAKMRRRWG